MSNLIKKFKKFLYNKNILSFILALIVYISLYLQNYISNINSISLLLLLMLIIFFKNLNLYNKKFFKSCCVFSFIFSFLTIFGEIVYINLFEQNDSVWKYIFTFKTVFSFLGLYILIYAILNTILPALYNYNIKKQSFLKPLSIFISAFFIILICWLPYLLVKFPGNLNIDSFVCLDMILNNFSYISNHHSIFYIMFIAYQLMIGMSIFNNINLAIAFYTIVQMLILDLIFSYFIYFLAKKNINKNIIIISILYFALLPIHGFSSISMWKDVLFSGIILLICIQLSKIVESLNFKDFVLLNIYLLLMIFVRNNGIYIYFILFIIMLVILKKYIKIIIPSFLLICTIYYGVTIFVFDKLNIEKVKLAEYIGIPIQQIGRMAYKKINFDSSDEKLLIKVMGSIDNLKNSYNPEYSDEIKFSKYYNESELFANKKDYFNMWIKLSLKHPDIALESYAVSTLGYWYPGIDYVNVNNIIQENNYGIKATPLLNKKIQTFIIKLSTNDIPLINLFWNTCLPFWVTSLFCYLCIKKRGLKFVLPYIPIFGIWLTLMIATPAIAEFRYIYASYTCLPLLIILPFEK